MNTYLLYPRLLKWGFVSLILLYLDIPLLYAQDHTLDVDDILEIPISKDNGQEIVSASKKSERLFESPLSASVITAEDMKKAGCTSIQQALRLFAGMIVREQSAGNFEFHIRGMDYLTPPSNYLLGTNNTTLVMIDNRPVYNYFSGGTFWESLPVSIIDVEQIELVRGPSASMYGPNALSGVINIITKKRRTKGSTVTARAMAGYPFSSQITVNAQHRANEKVNIGISTSNLRRNRYEKEILNFNAQTKVPFSSILQDTLLNLFYSDFREKSLETTHLNLFSDLSINRNIHTSVQGGLQQSSVLNLYGINDLAMTPRRSETKYINSETKIFNGIINASVLTGEQSTEQSVWDFISTDILAEYNIELSNRLSIKPGINYRKAVYTKDDSRIGYNNSIDDDAVFETFAGMLRIDSNPFQGLRVVGSIRADNFDLPEKTYVSYQTAVTYAIDNNNLIRAVYGKANRAPILTDVFLNNRVPLGNFGGFNTILSLQGNKNLELVKGIMYEIGYRSNLSKSLQLDFELYYRENSNYTDNVLSPTEFDFATGTITFPYQITNLSVQANQTGATLSMLFNSNNINFKPFISYQRTNLVDFSPYKNTAGVDSVNLANFGIPPNPSTMNIDTKSTAIHEATPQIVFGFTGNYTLNKFNINLQGYYLSAQNISLSFSPESIGIDPKLLLNLTMRYLYKKRYNFFVSGHNLTANNALEAPGGSTIASSIFFGIDFQF